MYSMKETCLKNCGMGIAEMKEYLALCLKGESTIPERKIILDRKILNFFIKFITLIMCFCFSIYFESQFFI